MAGKLARVKQIVASWGTSTVEELEGPGRAEDIVLTRHVCMYVMRQVTDSSLKEVGAVLGGRSPATVYYGYIKVVKLINMDRRLASWVHDLVQEIGHANLQEAAEPAVIDDILARRNAGMTGIRRLYTY